MKPLLCNWLIATVVLLHAQAVLAEVSVIGERRCEAWQDARGKNLPTTNIDKTWLNGFWSGMAVGTHKEFWHDKDGRMLDNDALYLWIDVYCNDNPSKDIADAAKELFRERTQDQGP